jgi:hypothetical protein
MKKLELVINLLVINDIIKLLTIHERVNLKRCVPLALGPLGMYKRSGPQSIEYTSHFHSQQNPMHHALKINTSLTPFIYAISLIGIIRTK